MLPRIALCAVLALPIAAEDLPDRAVQILKAQCSGCHSSATAMSGLRLDTRDALLKGGSRGAAVKPGSASSSLLVQAVRQSGKPAMPPGKKLSTEEVDLLARWVDGGAQWPEVVTSTGKASKWWSFQPPVRPAVPSVQDAKVRTPIDVFLLRSSRHPSFHLLPKPTAER